MRTLLIILAFWAYVGVYVYSCFPLYIDLIFTINSLLVALVLLTYDRTTMLGLFGLIVIMPEFFVQVLPFFGYLNNLRIGSMLLTLLIILLSYLPNTTQYDRIY
jgi:hypothetical protein